MTCDSGSNAARMTKCSTGILPIRTTRPEERAVIASFASYTPVETGPPTVDTLAKFKELLFLDTDPKWYPF